jgi:hypothetical protein
MKRRQSSRKRRPRKRAIKKFKPNLTYLHAYEEEIILADIRALGGQAVTAPGAPPTTPPMSSPLDMTPVSDVHSPVEPAKRQ